MKGRREEVGRRKEKDREEGRSLPPLLPYNIHRRLISKCPLVPECQTRSGTSIQWNTFRRYERILGWHLLQRGWTLETLCCENDDNHKRWYIVWFHFINYTEQSNAQMRKAKSWLPGIGGQEKWERTERIRSPW